MQDGSGGNIDNLLGMARTAAMAGNQGEALNYFNRVLEIDPTVAEAWIGKGNAAAWQSTLNNLRLNEALVAFQHAIAITPETERVALAEDLAGQLNAIVTALYQLARNHMLEFIALNNSWSDYLGQVSIMLDTLDGIAEWAPNHLITQENIVHLCKDNIEGVSYRDPYNSNAPGLMSLSPQYEELLKTRMELAVTKIQKLDSSYVAPTLQKKEADACFVVTATMGDFHHPHVTVLRRFRDQHIRPLPFGARLIKFYYRVGPSLADWIRPRPWARFVSYLILVRPAALIARRLLGTSGR